VGEDNRGEREQPEEDDLAGDAEQSVAQVSS